MYMGEFFNEYDWWDLESSRDTARITGDVADSASSILEKNPGIQAAPNKTLIPEYRAGWEGVTQYFQTIDAFGKLFGFEPFDRGRPRICRIYDEHWKIAHVRPDNRNGGYDHELIFGDSDTIVWQGLNTVDFQEKCFKAGNIQVIDGLGFSSCDAVQGDVLFLDQRKEVDSPEAYDGFGEGLFALARDFLSRLQQYPFHEDYYRKFTTRHHVHKGYWYGAEFQHCDHKKLIIGDDRESAASSRVGEQIVSQQNHGDGVVVLNVGSRDYPTIYFLKEEKRLTELEAKTIPTRRRPDEF